MNGKRIGIGLLVTGLLAWLLFQFKEAPSALNWRENYQAGSKDPYGTYFLYELLKKGKSPDGFVTLDESTGFVLPDSPAAAAYLFVGQFFEPDPAQLEVLLDFVNAGNQAFISTTRFTDAFMQRLVAQQCGETDWGGHGLIIDTVGLLSVTDRMQTPYTFRQEKGTSNYYWSYFSREAHCDGLSVFEELGYLNEIFPNYIRVAYGRGEWLLHTTPLAFSNYFLVKDSCLSYAEKTLAFVHPGKLYWDEWTRFPESQGKQPTAGNNPTDYTISPIRYILNHPPLAWAWYLLIALGLLFMIFRSKRTQRVIPLMAPPANSSLEFITTIGNLYYFQRDHKQIAVLSMKSLLRFIRTRYRLPVKDTLSGQEDNIALKAGVPAQELQRIGRAWEDIAMQDRLSAAELMNFHRLLESFYHQCK
ncbi:MAG: DUF4350 domain-containing protein [Saprospiraceae bacterium]|jgi:hypothetical protein|nr:DUF4350 domain-containing protein [Saprospiraceae bacterium]MDP4821783.1 DUF4350 domain-containing protein [Saprospiraceae bacterium]MDP4997939.1 DUF4350 domain-containing protein [Saprospiraceae bacterium]